MCRTGARGGTCQRTLNRLDSLLLFGVFESIRELAQRSREVAYDAIRMERIEEPASIPLDFLVLPGSLSGFRVMKDARQGKKALVIAEVLCRGHRRSDRGGPWTEFRNRVGCSGPAEGRAVGGDVIGLAIGSLDIPGVSADGNRIGFPVTRDSKGKPLVRPVRLEEV